MKSVARILFEAEEIKLPSNPPFPLSPYDMSKPQWRYLLSDIQRQIRSKPSKLSKVPLDSVYATQEWLNNGPEDNNHGKYAVFPVHKDAPVLAKVGKSYHIMDGHHRCSIEKLKGSASVDGYVYRVRKPHFASKYSSPRSSK